MSLFACLPWESILRDQQHSDSLETQKVVVSTQVCLAYRVNLGTADELALDMLINAMSNFSRE